jgi:hypothetical protein
MQAHLPLIDLSNEIENRIEEVLTMSSQLDADSGYQDIETGKLPIFQDSL